jgi:hypothetical protein
MWPWRCLYTSSSRAPRFAAFAVDGGVPASKVFLSRHVFMRVRSLALTLSGVLVASSGCSDATAPSSLAAPASAVASQGLSLRQQNELWAQNHHGGKEGRPTSYQVTIDPTQRNDLHFGQHTLSLPANSVCSLEGSGYGLPTFDQPCTAATQPIEIRATVSTDAQGHPRIDLQPEMRFDPAKTAVLTTDVGRAALLSAANWRIFYCSGAGRQWCVDESWYDPSLTTHVDLERGLVYRRIKHFSGYLTADS